MCGRRSFSFNEPSTWSSGAMSSSSSTTKWSRKHNVSTHFPKDQNCEVCRRTNITRAPCRKRTGNSIPRAKKFGDLTTADHKVLNEDGESRNSHKFAVIVQDLATRWLQAYPCNTKTSQETEKSLKKFVKPKESPKVIYKDNSLKFGKRVMISSGIIDPRQTASQKEQYAG